MDQKIFQVFNKNQLNICRNVSSRSER